MVALDRIRLTGLLRKGPREGPFLVCGALDLASRSLVNVGPETRVDHERARQLLERERERVLRELGELRAERGGDEELSKIDQHPADVGTELFEEERDQSLINRLEHDLEAIERAFKRLEQGTYGLSIESGTPIPDARLEAMPWADRTLDEQARLEAQEGNSR
jgi:DnaK suppressor protein